MLGPSVKRGKVNAVGTVEAYIVNFTLGGEEQVRLAFRTDKGDYFWLYPEPVEKNLKSPSTWIAKEIEDFRGKSVPPGGDNLG
jgi:hypothetical protein